MNTTKELLQSIPTDDIIDELKERFPEGLIVSYYLQEKDAKEEEDYNGEEMYNVITEGTFRQLSSLLFFTEMDLKEDFMNCEDDDEENYS